jgi:hypothetical protein
MYLLAALGAAGSPKLHHSAVPSEAAVLMLSNLVVPPWSQASPCISGKNCARMVGLDRMYMAPCRIDQNTKTPHSVLLNSVVDMDKPPYVRIDELSLALHCGVHLAASKCVRSIKLGHERKAVQAPDKVSRLAHFMRMFLLCGHTRLGPPLLRLTAATVAAWACTDVVQCSDAQPHFLVRSRHCFKEYDVVPMQVCRAC